MNFLAIDTETTGLNVWGSDIAFAVATCDAEGNTDYYEWPIDPYTRTCVYPPEDLAKLQVILENDRIEKVFHNAKFDYCMLQKMGLRIRGKIHDTSIAAKICNNDEIEYGLKFLANKYLGIPKIDESDLQEATNHCRRIGRQLGYFLGKDVEQDYWLPRLLDSSNNLCEQYCVMDTVRTSALHQFYANIIAKDDALRHGYDDEMVDTWPAVLAMERRGVRIDIEETARQLEQASLDWFRLRSELLDLVIENNWQPFDVNKRDKKGRLIKPPEIDEFNPGSDNQIRRILYSPPEEGGMGLATTRTTKTGMDSVDAKALREFMYLPFVQKVVHYNSAEQAISLFFSKYIHYSEQDKQTGEMILHPGLNQCGTTTFRFSCSKPNLQQVASPKSSRAASASYKPRAPFGPRKGYVWYSIDYSQQELRIFASVSQNEFLLNEIRAGRDPNNSVANRAWGGRDNPKALFEAARCLDFNQLKPGTPQVAELWEEYNWLSDIQEYTKFAEERNIVDCNINQLLQHPIGELCALWLEDYDYDITVAEAALGKSNLRTRAKMMFFNKIYGGGIGPIAELMPCSRAEAKEFSLEFDAAVPCINDYMRLKIREVRQNGFIINPYGRKLRIKQDLAYKGVNYEVQSTAACMMKDAIVRVHRYLLETGEDAHLVLTVHDELIPEMATNFDHAPVLREICRIMGDNKNRICVPMPVKVSLIENSWESKTSYRI